MELLARVEALLRRAELARRPAPVAVPVAAAPAHQMVTFGDVTVYPGTHTVTRAGAIVALRPKEYELLAALLARGGALATRLELLQEVWGYREDVASRTLDTHIAELRRKLEPDPASPRHILTVRKAGYRLETGSSEPGRGAA
jgi:DNA-binding response OmpR family regulator